LNHLRAKCRIFCFHYFYLRVVIEEIPALHQRNGVGVYLVNVRPVLIGQAGETMQEAQLVFTDDARTALTKQLVVL